MDGQEKRLIITAASASFEGALTALLGSLNCNWPEHPPVLVYDIGMGEAALAKLKQAGVAVRHVPPFCAHWRRHYSWKLWCMQDAPCDSFLWLDAAICVLAPMDEAFRCAESLGYFAVPAGYPLAWGVNAYLRRRYAIDDCALAGAPAIIAGCIAMSKAKCATVLVEACELACIEDAMVCTRPYERHDMDVLGVLLPQCFGPLLIADGRLYGEWIAPGIHHGQKVWIHRRRMRPEDTAYFAAHIGRRGAPHAPRAPDFLNPPRNAMQRLRIWLARKRGRYGYPPRLPTPIGGGVHDGVRDDSC